MLTHSSLPVDILIIVLESLGIPELAALSRTCHLMHSIVAEYGWASYLRSNPRPSCSLSKARNLWLPRSRARYDVMTDASWARTDFIARPLSRIWNGRLQPILAISPSRLLVAAGSNIYSYSFGTSNDGSAASPPIFFEGSVSLLLRHQPERPRNITAIAFVEDRGLDRTLDVAFQDGGIERVFLHSVADVPDGGIPQLFLTRNSITPMPDGDFVESMSSESNIVLTLSSNGHARLCATTNLLLSDSSNPRQHPNSTLDLQARSWVSYLCLQSSTPYAAFGTSSTTPLNLHSLTDGGILSELPTAILHTQKATLDKLPSSAVYGLARGPLNSPWGASPQILVSGWYDGQVRCYDLRASDSCLPRTPSQTNTESGMGTSASPNPLRPVLLAG
ncbi:hypothetical protein NLJ89_g10998 [Agrocybe chaxingu]|uniref:F-box domain-containing protein n=1 Tax=Agrocybe chaxingu TaxID=84603 RepID=A0A9W8JPM0_9AGAR|nr:hypothetical protein NLJ89_g10998 [Agrocybe chaxingu]